MVIRARCPIAKGDEVFIPYVNPTHGDRAGALNKWLPDGCACEMCGYDKLEGAARLLRRKQELMRLPDLLTLAENVRPGKHADVARRIQDAVDSVQSTYNSSRPATRRPELVQLLRLKASLAFYSNPLAPPLDQIVAADLAAMESVGALVVVTKVRTNKLNFKAKKKQPDAGPRATTSVSVAAAPFDCTNESIVALASAASTCHRLKKSSEALVWLRAAIEMSTMVYGGGQDAFVARFAGQLKQLGTEGWEGIMSQL